MHFTEIRVQGGKPIRAWTKGVPVEDAALEQLRNIAGLPFVHSHVAAMPDVHLGKGATVGSVIPTVDAIVPAAVGVDIGCGMSAVRTNIPASRLPDSLAALRSEVEAAVPHGRTAGGDRRADRGAWSDIPGDVAAAFEPLQSGLARIVERQPAIGGANDIHHLGTLGTGNHFIELCLDEEDRLWAMLHSGSRGIGNRIGMHFIAAARREMERWFIRLPDRDLAYLAAGTELFDDYVFAVEWAQAYAAANRACMTRRVLDVLRRHFPDLRSDGMAVNCHHNYVARERHFKKEVWLTRKGAVSAREGELGIVPGSMGARSYIVRGRGNPLSFHSCAHGAGRRMSRTEARRSFSLADHAAATEGVECRKDAGMLDETPGAYKDIDRVMAAQSDLVEVVHSLRQVLCVKG